MTQETKERRTVAAIVEKKGDGKQGHEASLNIPEFESQYPTLVNRIPDADFEALVPGKTINVILGQGRLQKQRDRTPYDGSKPWMFWWEWIGLAPAGSAAAATPQRAHVDGVQLPGPIDLKANSIERQVALIQAVQWGIARPASTTRDVLTVAEAFIQWLQHGEIPGSPTPESRPAKASASPEARGPATATMERFEAHEMSREEFKQAREGRGISLDDAELILGKKIQTWLKEGHTIGEAWEIIRMKELEP